MCQISVYQPSWNSSMSVLAMQILSLILVPWSLLGKVQTVCVKQGMKMKTLHMHPFYYQGWN